MGVAVDVLVDVLFFVAVFVDDAPHGRGCDQSLRPLR